MKRENNFLTLFPILHSNRQNKKNQYIQSAKDYFYAHFGFTNIKELSCVLITRTPSKTVLHIFCTDLRHGEHSTIYPRARKYTDRLFYDNFQNQTNV